MFEPLLKSCPISSQIFPDGSFFPAFRKLPSLSTILLKDPFLVSPPSQSQSSGFFPSPNCSCKVCREAHFCSTIASPSLPDRGYKINQHMTCKNEMVVYLIVCKVCDKAYVGQTQDPRQRWSSHKSQIRLSCPTCNLAKHCSTQYSEDMVGGNKLMDSATIKDQLQYTLLEYAEDRKPLYVKKKPQILVSSWP